MPVIQIDRVKITRRNLGGMHGERDVCSRTGITAHFQQVLTRRIDPEIRATRGIGKRGPADAGPVSGFLGINVAVKQRWDETIVDRRPGT
jgi:hypothetical protein